MSDYDDDFPADEWGDEEQDDPVAVKVVRVIRETEKAILVEVWHGPAGGEVPEEVWVPKSQIDDDSEVYSLKSGPGKLLVTAWLARQKGWA